MTSTRVTERRAGEDTFVLNTGRQILKSTVQVVAPEASELSEDCHEWSEWYCSISSSWQPDAQQRSAPAEEDGATTATW